MSKSNEATLKAGDVWEQCTDRCRTNSHTIEGVWNGYRSDLKHCFGHGHSPDYSSTHVEISMAEIEVVKAPKANMNCKDACETKGKKCVHEAFHHINKCDILQKHFDCKGCEESVGPEQPAFVVPTAADRFPRGKCLFTRNPGGIACEAQHVATQRLCTCQ